ncbi:pseudaminic acid cytidylyltransferase [Desulfohalobium retbaense]|uniref:Pseudaminic acid CMP-transferase n=1 Tax=Desulfohalobium retbaense (strain ATCC 49708 / DSM 5692 / JCM 16813 / HR100) TaxID=485915 RepID=C8WZ01_DESRD|nr:pseudaminic acid cytidylyltransferase [Desulfohalobium retbaense]ACV67917.1 pseudaminic acid CMP-transferase [Desulfohalobium retbaense DSM 5692]
MTDSQNTENPQTVCIIPARSGSKRIPDKNIRLFLGKPVIWYPIQAARDSNLFDRIIVSTDSEKIAAIARETGAETPFLRPQELADDFTPVTNVFQHVVQWMRNNQMDPKFICGMYATALFVQKEHLVQGYDMIRKGKSERAFTVAPFPSPIFRALKINRKGHLEMIWPENFKTRSQDFFQVYYNAGQFHWYHVDSLMEPSHNTESVSPIIISKYLAIDIDTQEDWEQAEMTYWGILNFRR